ncbi:hypothetical protein BTO04_13265 [Polaribacter sp. SA4-10]|uniref:hypothetical protein n=1 Tax=Polaribacter sp. SA4-10 TaxID=754397 RepID=UPI000B3C0C39|nr:hypothetical protein [Polaribacter sp. SA4-10]ARV07599.1 hypothetical protein BTO04_13265 [Polaribacter sp. SA4-10]
MKNFKLLIFIFSIAITFSSCSTNETILPEEQSLDLLKSYSVKRDANGAYSVDFDLNKNAASENVLDVETNTHQILLYSIDNQLNRKVSQDLTIDGTQLKVGFVDANSNNSPHITIIDDNITLAKTSAEHVMLKEYRISSNEDGTFNLDFSVKNNVSVGFVYNEDIDTYEIHLEEGKTTETSFTRILEKEEGQLLKFDFVNHITTNTSAKSAVADTITRKPRVIIGTGETVD